MKTTQAPADCKMADVTINPDLDKYERVVLFPRQLALAKERLKNARIPQRPPRKA